MTKTPGDHVGELRDIVVGYAKQETVDPLVRLKHFGGFGAVGSLLIGIGCCFLLLALLRGLQSIDTFGEGGWLSLVPYAAAWLVGAVMIGLAVWGVSRSTHQERT